MNERMKYTSDYHFSLLYVRNYVLVSIISNGMQQTNKITIYGYRSSNRVKLSYISIRRREIKELSESNTTLHDCYYGPLA